MKLYTMLVFMNIGNNFNSSKMPPVFFGVIYDPRMDISIDRH